VSLHLRLSERSEGIVGERELRLQQALLDALHKGHIRGAALDVYDQEPLPPGHPLLDAPRTVLTPHLGYVTHESYQAFLGGAFEDVRAWLDGAPIRRLA
jgi:phosphoglycerate dehydrogenase-like enzyme